MRRLDSLLGRPLCRLLTLWRDVCCIAFPVPVSSAAPRRLLFIQLAEAGSMVLADPALAAAERRGAMLFFLTLARNAPALVLTGRVAVERVVVLRDDSLLHLLRDVWQLRQWARGQGIDAVVDLELFARLTAVLSWWTGVSRRAGFHAEEGGALYRGRLYSDPVGFNAHRHMAQNYLRLVVTLFDGAHAAALAADPLAMRVRLTASSLQARQDLRGLFERLRPAPGHKIVLVNPNAGQRLPQRRWPEANFVELIGQLLAIRPDIMVMLIGSAEDRDCTAAIARAVGRARCMDIAGELPIASLPALFERSQLLIGNDSGPAHFAAVSDLPVVVLFGPETPVLFRPLGPGTVLTAQLSCSPCISPANQRRSGCRDNRCMQHIAVAEVLGASLERLSLPRRPLAVADSALRA